MKLTRILRVSLAAGAWARAHRLTNPYSAGKYYRGVVALAGFVGALAATAPRAEIAGAWHVGPRPSVCAIARVGDTLWVGTADGLFRLDIRDGSQIDHIVAGPRLPSASVRAIAARGDTVFVATDGGIVLFHGNRADVFTPESPGALRRVPLARISSLTVGANGDILIGSLGSGAGIYTPSGGYTITQRDSLLDDAVYAIADGRRGVRYFASPAGLCAQLDDTTFAWYQAGSGLPRGEARALAPDDRGVYVLVARQGLYRFERERAARIDGPPGVSMGDALAISSGADGALWAVGEDWAAVRRGRAWKKIGVPGAGADVRWRTVVADGAGAWLGSADGVVLAVERGSAFNVKLAEGLPCGRVESLAADGRGGAWFVNGGRVIRADAVGRRVMAEKSPADARAITISPSGDVVAAGRWTIRRLSAGGWSDLAPDVIAPDPAFTAVHADVDGRLWVGTRNGTVYRYDGEIWLRMMRAADATAGHSVIDLAVGRGGAWAIVAGTPVRCVGGGAERFPGIDTTETAVDIERSPAGDWIVVTPSGLFRFDEKTRAWQTVSPRALAGGKETRFERRGRLTSIAFDSRGRAYIGSTGGLGLVDAAGVRWMGARDGIGGGWISVLRADGERLWVGFVEDGFSVLPVGAVW